MICTLLGPRLLRGSGAICARLNSSELANIMYQLTQIEAFRTCMLTRTHLAYYELYVLLVLRGKVAEDVQILSRSKRVHNCKPIIKEAIVVARGHMFHAKHSRPLSFDYTTR